MGIAAEYYNNLANIEREYIYYNYSDAKYKANFDETSNLVRLMNNERSKFVSRFNKINNVSLTEGQIQDLLNNWSYNGEAGSKILDYLNAFNPDENGVISGANTSASVVVGDGTLSNAISNFNSSKAKRLDGITKIISGVNNSIDNVIKLLADTENYLLATAVATAYYSGSESIPRDVLERLGIGNETASITKSDIKLANQKMVSVISTIRENISSLVTLSGEIESKTSKESASLFSNYVNALKASFNSVGGTMYELAVQYAAMLAIEKGEKIMRENDAKICSIIADRGKLESVWTGQAGSTESEKTELKDDVQIVYGKDGISFTYGINVKTRQGRKFKEHTQSLPLEGLTARDNSMLSQALDKIERQAGIADTQEKAAQLIGNKQTEGGFSEQWAAIKQLAGAVSLVDALSGLGGKYDFSSLLLINGKIFSIYDILLRISDPVNIENQMTSGNKKMYLVEGMDYTKVRANVSEKAKEIEETIVGKSKGQRNKSNNLIVKGISRTFAAYKTLQTTKISITLNLGHIYNSNIFK